MNNILTLPIDNLRRIQISVPEIDRKINYFYPVSENLHNFDEAIVAYICNYEHIVLATDALGTGILESFINCANQIFQNERELPKKIKLGELGFAWCEYAENLSGKFVDRSAQNAKEDDVFYRLWVFSGNEIQTWMYTVNKKIILEISPSYKWSLDEPKEGDIYISYQEFIKDYKPIAVIELDENTVKNWLKKCQDLLAQLKND